MAVLNLSEAAEQAATSKVDVWRAIQEGALPAQKTNDGGYAIDPTDLFRVFERKRPKTGLTPPDLSPASKGALVAKTDEASELAAANDVSVAFAALQAELKSLLGSRGEASPAGEETRSNSKNCSGDEQNGPLTNDLAAEKAEAGMVIVEGAAPTDSLATPAETRRTWWRRLAS